MKLAHRTVIVAAAALTLAACGDDADTPDETSQDATEAPDDLGDDGSTDGMDDASDEDAGDGSTVSVVDNDFDPGELEVAAGDTVEWTHEGDVPHNVTFDDEASDTLESGDTYERTFDEQGEFEYTCTFHSGMDGTVTVS